MMSHLTSSCYLSQLSKLTEHTYNVKTFKNAVASSFPLSEEILDLKVAVSFIEPLCVCVCVCVRACVCVCVRASAQLNTIIMTLMFRITGGPALLF